MKIEDGINYTVLSNKIDNILLDNFKEYKIIDENTSYKTIIDLIAKYINKSLVFKEVLRKFNKNEVNNILNLLKERHVNFINITGDIEEVLYSDFIYIYNNNDLVIETSLKDLPNCEKILKKIGFSLPFVVDLSLQLKLYNVLDTIYFDMESLVHHLWN